MAQDSGKSSKGAVIVADYKEPVRFLDQEGQLIDFGNELRGSIITEGQTAQVGIGGKLVLLFSNGTITTLQSQSKMKIGVFEQVPFDLVILETQKNYDQMESILSKCSNYTYLFLDGIFIRKDYLE